MSTTYGQEVKPKDDPYVKLADESSELVLHALLPGASLANRFPIRASYCMIEGDDY